MRDRGDTRSRIQAVALELFTEKGYEATSLREVAERLGVTKAALYYHFKTKEDIIASLMQDRVQSMDELLEWARDKPHTTELRREFLRRYSQQLHDSGHHNVMRFMERNQTALRDHPKSEEMRGRMLEMLDILSSPQDPLPVRLKCAMSIFAMHATWFVFREGAISDEERASAALEVALELVEASPGDRVPAPAATPEA